MRARRNYQLDLFSPDDGHFEYSAVATNLTLSPRALWNFIAGRGAQEKTFAERKGEFALDAVPTNHYAANSAWQQLSILAHNLTIGFQLHSNLATAKPNTAKRTYSYWLVSIKTLRFTIINRAARVARISRPQDPALFPQPCHPSPLPPGPSTALPRDLFSLWG